jgi:hypothetical protein
VHAIAEFCDRFEYRTRVFFQVSFSNFIFVNVCVHSCRRHVDTELQFDRTSRLCHEMQVARVVKLCSLPAQCFCFVTCSGMVVVA